VSEPTISIPDAYGKVTRVYHGDPRKGLLVIIEETHVAANVQKNVSAILKHLHDVYGLNLLMVEGMNGPIDMAQIKALPDKVARRQLAQAFLDQRIISGVDFIALTEDQMTLFGVEDLAAQKEHDKFLEGLGTRQKAWAENLTTFLKWRLASVITTHSEAERFKVKLDGYVKTEEFQKFSTYLRGLLRSNPTALAELETLDKEWQIIDTELKVIDRKLPSTKSGFMVTRDTAMVNNSLPHLSRHGIGAVVIGAAHTPGFQRLLEQQSTQISYIVVSPRALDRSLAHEPGPDQSRADWLKESEADSALYKRWKNQELSSLEEWLKNARPSKPPMVAARESFKNEFVLLATLSAASKRLSAGYSLSEIQRRLRDSGVSNVEITNAVVGNTANAVRFRYGSLEAWVIVSSQAIGDLSPLYKTIETISLGQDRYIWVSAPGESGGGTPPPISPRPGGSLAPNPSDPIFIPPESWRRAQPIIPLTRKIREYQAKLRTGNRQSDALISFFIPEGSDRLYRQIGDVVAELSVTATAYHLALGEFKQAEKQQKRSKARELLAYLSEDLYRDLPEGTSTLIDASSQLDFSDINLPGLAAIAGDSDYELLRGVSYYKTGQAGKEPLQRAMDKILAGIPTVSLKNMGLWIVGDPGTNDAERQIKALFASKGIAVNDEPKERSTLLIVNLSAPRPDITVTLPDGASALNSPQRANLMGRPANVIAINSTLSSDLVERVGAVWTSEGTIAPDVIVSMVQGMLKAIEANDGKLSVSEVMKRASIDLLDNTSRLELFSEVKSSLDQVAASEHLRTGKDGI
jgi:hypothetical protein